MSVCVGAKQLLHLVGLSIPMFYYKPKSRRWMQLKNFVQERKLIFPVYQYICISILKHVTGFLTGFFIRFPDFCKKNSGFSKIFFPVIFQSLIFSPDLLKNQVNLSEFLRIFRIRKCNTPYTYLIKPYNFKHPNATF